MFNKNKSFSELLSTLHFVFSIFDILVSESRLSTSLVPSGETGLLHLRPKTRCVRGRLFGYPTLVVEGVGERFISVRESLIS